MRVFFACLEMVSFGLFGLADWFLERAFGWAWASFSGDSGWVSMQFTI
mgnify:FL=1